MIDILQASIFNQLAALLLLAGLLGFVALKLRQPLIVAFIALGLLVGPDALGIINGSDHVIDTLAELGVTLLLFLVGLKLDVSLIKRLGPAALTTGLIMVATMTLLGGAIIALMGYDLQTAMLAGIALSFSSTIIVVKLLSDKRAIDSLYGKMALGILIVEDIVVILAMVAVTALGGSETAPGMEAYLMIFLKIVVLAVLTGAFIHFLATPLAENLARAPELMIIFAIGLAAVMAAICHQMGLSKELGGLLAGIALASTPQHNIIASHLAPLRDFLLLFFFVGLGIQMDLSQLGGQLLPAFTLTAVVFLLKPAVIMTVMTLSGYRKRTGFMTGLCLSQISEFSLIFMAMAAEMGLVPADIIGLFTLTALLTIGLSCYAIVYNTELHDKLERHLPLRERKSAKHTEKLEEPISCGRYDVIIFGLGRYGGAMARQFEFHGQRVLGIDFDPAAVKATGSRQIHAVYGDAADPDLPQQLPLHNARVVVFAFHHYFAGPLSTDLRHTLANILRNYGYKGHIAATSHNHDQDVNLKSHGIDLVLNPFEDAALHGANHILRIIEAEKKSRE